MSLRSFWFTVGLAALAVLVGCSAASGQDTAHANAGKSAINAGERHRPSQTNTPTTPAIQPIESSSSLPALPAVTRMYSVGYLTQTGPRGQGQRLVVVVSLSAKLLIPEEEEFERLRSGKGKTEKLAEVPSRHHVRVLDPKRFTITLADGRTAQADSVLFRPESDAKCVVTIIGGRHVETDIHKPVDPEELRQYAVGVKVEQGEVRPPLRISLDNGRPIEIPAQLVALPSAPFEMPKFDLPKFNVPKFDIPKFNPPKLPTFTGPPFTPYGRAFTIPRESYRTSQVPRAHTPVPKTATRRPTSSLQKPPSPNKAQRPAVPSNALGQHHSSPEDRAKPMLRMARLFVDKRPEKAREYAEKIIELAPNSESAKEARSLLEQLVPFDKAP